MEAALREESTMEIIQVTCSDSVMSNDKGCIALQGWSDTLHLKVIYLLALAQRTRRALMNRFTSKSGVPDHSIKERPSRTTRFG